MAMANSSIVKSFELTPELLFDICSHNIYGVYGEFKRTGFSIQKNKEYGIHSFVSKDLYVQIKKNIVTLDLWIQNKTFTKSMILSRNVLLKLRKPQNDTDEVTIQLMYLDKDRKTIDELKSLELTYSIWSKFIGLQAEIDPYLKSKKRKISMTNTDDDDQTLTCFRLVKTNQSANIAFEWTLTFEQSLMKMDAELSKGTDCTKLLIEQKKILVPTCDEILKYAYIFLLNKEILRLKGACVQCQTNSANQHECVTEPYFFIAADNILNIEIKKVSKRLASFLNITFTEEMYDAVHKITGSTYEVDIAPCIESNQMIMDILQCIW
ncbi:unnamed protein product [Owenia fusiformis]|uniref:Uncharacterized protein n=1 Tax=Owenia fusiformis TaxID=6347 RepID=A0A8S4NKA3_OWEFU|nr:unnamed protein product [Owenia fusiformis]